MPGRPIRDANRRGAVTLLFSAHDIEHNGAGVLRVPRRVDSRAAVASGRVTEEELSAMTINGERNQRGERQPPDSTRRIDHLLRSEGRGEVPVPSTGHGVPGSDPQSHSR